MSLHQLLTIGYSNRSIDEFIALLRRYDIGAVADVRSRPFSARSPHYNIQSLKTRIKEAGVAYVFMGNQLGARRVEAECYDGNQAKYSLIAKTDAFRKGLDRIRHGCREHRVALMCAEKDPIVCHRMVLVCRHLKDEIDIFHILDSDTIESQHQSELRLLESLNLPSRDLFDGAAALLDVAYETQANRIAFRRPPLGGEDEDEPGYSRNRDIYDRLH